MKQKFEKLTLIFSQLTREELFEYKSGLAKSVADAILDYEKKGYTVTFDTSFWRRHIPFMAKYRIVARKSKV